jgi:hypothetical protein
MMPSTSLDPGGVRRRPPAADPMLQVCWQPATKRSVFVLQSQNIAFTEVHAVHGAVELRPHVDRVDRQSAASRHSVASAPDVPLRRRLRSPHMRSARSANTGIKVRPVRPGA